MYKKRKDETGFDSISWINPEYARYLALHYGADASIFKTVINSGGEGQYLLFGKTAFFVDPLLNKFFAENPNIDVLMTRSADKLKSAPEGMLHSNYTEFGNKDLMPIKMKNIGIIKSFSKMSPAKNAPSMYQNLANDLLVGDIFKSIYEPNLIKGLDNMNEIRSSDLAENYAVRELLGGSRDLDNMFEIGSNYRDYSNLLLHSEVAPWANPSSFDRSAVADLLLNKFVAPGTKPYSQFYDSAVKEWVTSGAKSPIGQNFLLEKKCWEQIELKLNIRVEKYFLGMPN